MIEDVSRKRDWFMYRPELLLVARPTDELDAELWREEPGSDRIVLSILRDQHHEVEYSVHDNVKAARARAYQVLRTPIDWRVPPPHDG